MKYLSYIKRAIALILSVSTLICFVSCTLIEDSLYDAGIHVNVNDIGNDIESGIDNVKNDLSEKTNSFLDGFVNIFKNLFGGKNSEVEKPPEYDDVISLADTIINDGSSTITTQKNVSLSQPIGEVMGYLYDIAKLNPIDLAKHAYSDLTAQYKNDAANNILSSISSIYSEDTVVETTDMISKAIKTTVVASEATFETIDLLGKLSDGDFLSILNNSSEVFDGISVIESSLNLLGDFIHNLNTLNTNEKAALIIITSNYTSVEKFLKRQATICIDDNMKDIYNIAYNKLKDHYNSIINNYLKNPFELIDFNVILDAVDITAKVSNISMIKSLFVNSLSNQVSKYAALSRSVSVLLIAHSAVALIGGKLLGGDATYESMQALYENYIVLDSMNIDITDTLDLYKKEPNTVNSNDLIFKAVCLSGYKSFTLDNCETYRKSNLTGETFLNKKVIEQEKDALLASQAEIVKYLR